MNAAQMQIAIGLNFPIFLGMKPYSIRLDKCRENYMPFG